MLNERHEMLNQVRKNAKIHPLVSCFSIEKNYIFLILEKQRYISKSIEIIRTKNRILFFVLAKLSMSPQFRAIHANIDIRRYSNNIVF